MSTKPKTLDEAFTLITKEMLDIFLKKHQDYGKSNILSIQELGIAYRETEKIERLKHLLSTNATPTNEPINDTWIDIGVYAVIALMLRKGWFQSLELQD